jgi:hypothetical protein
MRTCLEAEPGVEGRFSLVVDLTFDGAGDARAVTISSFAPEVARIAECVRSQTEPAAVHALGHAWIDDAEQRLARSLSCETGPK